jgi:hypothetical protein
MPQTRICNSCEVPIEDSCVVCKRCTRISEDLRAKSNEELDFLYGSMHWTDLYANLLKAEYSRRNRRPPR